MKVIIVLKKEHADGLGGEVLTDMGMLRSSLHPVVFSTRIPIDQAKEASLPYVEALSEYGIRPVRVFSQTDAGALTTLHG